MSLRMTSTSSFNFTLLSEDSSTSNAKGEERLTEVIKKACREVTQPIFGFLGEINIKGKIQKLKISIFFYCE